MSRGWSPLAVSDVSLLHFLVSRLLVSPSLYSSFFFFNKILFIFRKRGREGEREGKKHGCERETSIDCLSHALTQGLNPQSRHVP